MGTILQFAPRSDSARRSAECADDIRGVVVIFPGVRIERHGAKAPKRPQPQTRKKTQRYRKKQRS